jgi:hypothetical protein
MEFYSATKNKENLSFASKWMELENIILSKVSQAKKAQNHMLFLICGLWTQNKCSNITGYGSHTKGTTCTGQIGKGKATYNLNVVDVLTREK